MDNRPKARKTFKTGGVNSLSGSKPVGGHGSGGFSSETKKYDITCQDYWKALMRFGVEADIISVTDQFEDYRLILAPMLFLIKPETAQKLKDFPDYPVRYFYSVCGTEDGTAYGAASAAAKELPKHTDRLTEENWHWQERSGGHDFAIWNLGLYNFARVMGELHE